MCASNSERAFSSSRLRGKNHFFVPFRSFNATNKVFLLRAHSRFCVGAMVMKQPLARPQMTVSQNESENEPKWNSFLMQLCLLLRQTLLCCQLDRNFLLLCRGDDVFFLLSSHIASSGISIIVKYTMKEFANIFKFLLRKLSKSSPLDSPLNVSTTNKHETSMM